MLDTLSRMLISRSLDDGRPPPAWVARRLERSAELRRFAGSAARVDRALSATPPPDDEPSPFLATRIRAAVESVPAPSPRERVWSPRLVLGVSACALALAGVFVAASLLRAPAPDSRPPHPLAGGWPPFGVPSPTDVAASTQRQLENEAREMWQGTQRFARVVMARFPSPPTLPR